MGIGKRIKQAREHLGLTQKELAKLVDVTASAITNYENGTSHPKETVLYKLLSELEVDANFLFQDEMAKTKISPESDIPTSEDILQNRVQLLSEYFTKAGYIEKDKDISDDTLRLFKSLVDFLDSYFEK